MKKGVDLAGGPKILKGTAVILVIWQQLIHLRGGLSGSFLPLLALDKPSMFFFVLKYQKKKNKINMFDSDQTESSSVRLIEPIK